MSIVERVAGLLEPLDRPASRGGDQIEPRLVERVAARETTRTPSIPERNAHAQPEDNVLPLDAKGRQPAEQGDVKMPEILRVDRDHLRRQGLITPDGDRTANAESFRRIKRQLLAKVIRSKAETPANLMMITSSLPGEGKTFCAVSLAISLALEMDRTVLLVDADVANPSVPKALGIKAQRGLLDVLQDRRIDLAEVLCKTDIGKLTFMPAGTAHPHATELLASEAMAVLLKELAERYHDRIILFDSPPLLAASEAGVLASHMGQLVIVVEAGKTPDAALKSALSRIDANKVAGLLLNKGEDPGLRYHYGEYGKIAK